jgi:tRNA nucleotidyltransferase (CCA-adding enzyme)
VLVGGWVRDYLLGHPHSKDYDVEVFGLEPRPLRKLLRRFGPVHAVGRHFGVLKLVTGEAEYDVSLPRKESKTGRGHKGFWVETDPGLSFEAAASRRDFTINAMGYAFLEDAFLDPFGGEADLRAKLLRHVGPAFGEDPLRVLRAMQFVGRFAFAIAPETVAICREQNLAELPRERIWEELKKLLLAAPAPSLGLEYAGPLGVLAAFPELQRLAEAPPTLQGEGAPWSRTMAVVDEAARLRTGEPHEDVALMLAALCHALPAEAPPKAAKARSGEGAPSEGAVRRFLERLTNEPRLIGAVQRLVRELPEPERLFAERNGETDGQIRWLSARVSPPFLERLARARYRAGRPARDGEAPFEAGDWFLARAKALGVLSGPPKPLLTGQHLKEMGFKEGRALGRFLKEAYAMQMEGKLRTRRQALAWAGRRLEEEPRLHRDEPGSER